MSHSQFHCIMLILRLAWLSLLDEHMLLAGSTRYRTVISFHLIMMMMNFGTFNNNYRKI